MLKEAGAIMHRPLLTGNRGSNFPFTLESRDGKCYNNNIIHSVIVKKGAGPPKKGEIDMEYRRFEDTVIMRLDPDEEILEELIKLAKKEKITLAEVEGLGALKQMNVCVFDTVSKEYYTNSFEEPMELLSLSGTITQMDGETYLHIHASAGNAKGLALGGHLKKAVISATGEIVVRILNGQVGRRFSEKIGLNLLAFDSEAGKQE